MRSDDAIKKSLAGLRSTAACRSPLGARKRSCALAPGSLRCCFPGRPVHREEAGQTLEGGTE
jgi:hypothetical protein